MQSQQPPRSLRDAGLAVTRLLSSLDDELGIMCPHSWRCHYGVASVAYSLGEKEMGEGAAGDEPDSHPWGERLTQQSFVLVSAWTLRC